MLVFPVFFGQVRRTFFGSSRVNFRQCGCIKQVFKKVSFELEHLTDFGGKILGGACGNLG
jgi:hypothetical protein